MRTRLNQILCIICLRIHSKVWKIVFHKAVLSIWIDRAFQGLQDGIFRFVSYAVKKQVHYRTDITYENRYQTLTVLPLDTDSAINQFFLECMTGFFVDTYGMIEQFWINVRSQKGTVYVRELPKEFIWQKTPKKL